jgi:catechol 2,3-dioxygenase-like lactoylglutathione lyase family enzyme
MFTITAMDHIVLNVQDMPRVLDFYINVLGLKGERLEEFQQGKVSFPSVRISNDTLIDLFPIPAAGEAESVASPAHLNHFCLVIDKTDMQQVIAHLEKHGVAVQQGPVQRWGAHGNGTSIYFCDPEKRQIEIRFYDHNER